MLPEGIKRINNPQEYEVKISNTLEDITANLEERLREKYS